MGDLNGLLHFLRQPWVPNYISLVIVCVMAARIYPLVMARWNERQRDRETAKDGDWKRLRGEIDRLDERCEQIEKREQDCQRQLADAHHRIGLLEGYNDGRGEAKQEAQRMLSAEREADAEMRKGEGK